jgi:hypothetical protein
MFHISAKVNIFLPKINGRDQNDKQRLFKDQSETKKFFKGSAD